MSCLKRYQSAGFANPGEMVLCLSTPVQVAHRFENLLGGTDLDLFTSTAGDIRYDGLPQKEMLNKFRSDLIYNPELDIHMPH